MRFIEYRRPDREPDFTDLTIAVFIFIMIIGAVIALVEGRF